MPPLSFQPLPLLPISSLHEVLLTDQVKILTSLTDECVYPLGDHHAYIHGYHFRTEKHNDGYDSDIHRRGYGYGGDDDDGDDKYASEYNRVLQEESSKGCSTTNDWWFVKASKGNGGRDIWIINQNNYAITLANIATSTNNTTDEFVIQQYAPDPMLWRGKKFHFRVYAGMKANMTAYVYQMAFILTAGVDHDGEDSNEEEYSKHISNLSVNKHIEGLLIS